jgi:subtilisin family serine protease
MRIDPFTRLRRQRPETKTDGGLALAISWGDSEPKKLLLGMLALVSVLLLVLPPAPGEATESVSVSVIVRHPEGAGREAREAIRDLGGIIVRRLGIISSFEAKLPTDKVGLLDSVPSVASVTPNTSVRLLDYRGDDDRDDRHDDYEPTTDVSSMYSIAQEITGASDYWKDGFTGDGVGVALIDSGVAPVRGLLTRGKVVNGVDLSFESQSPHLRHLDTFGHGTHMAGIIAGRDPKMQSWYRGRGPTPFLGMAPDSHIINVKVSDAMGATDVSQVIAAIDWVVQHRNDRGLNVRVLNLSFGTDGVQDYRLDPLSHAVEVAWRKGIVVVAAAGNGGYGSNKLNNPAYDPYVLAVGAADGNGTYAYADDTIPPFSSCGDALRHPDLVAPGKSVASLRSFSSSADLLYPSGRVGTRFFRGTGTSQAAAVVSGAAALLLEQRPGLTPDQVKALLTSSANELPEASAACQGAGMIDLRRTRTAPTPQAVQNHPISTGLGSLDAARGSASLAHDGVVLEGEIDIFGNPWDAKSWSAKSWSGSSWAGGTWNGESWSGSSWSGKSWSGSSWSAITWLQNSWSGKSWSDSSWSGKSWSGKSWSGKSWSGKSWSGNSWSSDYWGD